MTRAQRSHAAAARFAREAVAVRDPLAIAATQRDLGDATRRLNAQRSRCALIPRPVRDAA